MELIEAFKLKYANQPLEKVDFYVKTYTKISLTKHVKWLC